ncbi:ATP-binding protein [Geobacter sp. SVR]|uniref:PAS domain-containing sensor histidine kinase n=1 Tax=Geobacter sp. SVR TaxID=2495594 RepID=UPI00143EFAE8|nr:ATP-binding protein [Geobacter sp. SVR]BCS54220.1 hypothetical protein GSVR_25280 [Geobacter sp. SVR]GCF85922.1 hypothetical protein GSbR_25220 [Geobacter sp. SVR]
MAQRNGKKVEGRALSPGAPEETPFGTGDHEAELETLTRHLRETQRLLEESRDRYADLYDYAPLGYVTLTRNGLIRESNSTFARMVGHDQRFLMETPFTGILASTSQLSPFLEHLGRCSRSHQRVVTEVRLRHKNGSEMDVELSSTSVADYRSRSTLYRTAVIDISDRKRTERELQAVKEDLETRVQERTAELSSEIEQRLKGAEELRLQEKLLLQQSRMAAMGEMIGNIAHQWRQPLNGLGLMFQSLLMEYEMGSFTKEFLDEMVSHAMKVIAHMSRTIDDFREFFKVDKAWVVFDLKRLLQISLSMAEAGLREQRVTVDLQCEEGLQAGGFPNEFSQAVLNLLTNACDALAERQVPEPVITIRAFSELGRTVVTLADNAGGIPAEIIKRIFDPYFTTKGDEKGTGIGLFMSKTIIEKNMHGSLTVRNTGQGAEFRIELAGQTERSERDSG